jgi:chromosomal replication initiation ATPase DnaA
MDVVQLGKALVPKSRLKEFTGQKKTMAELEEQMRPPPSESEMMQQRLDKLEQQVAALRRLIILSQASATAAHTRRLQIREEESVKMARLERIYFKLYTGTKVSLSTIMSTARTRPVSDARMILFASIVRAEPSIAKSAIAARYGKDQAAIHWAMRRIELATPSQRRNCDEIVKVYRLSKENPDGRPRE